MPSIGLSVPSATVPGSAQIHGKPVRLRGRYVYTGEFSRGSRSVEKPAIIPVMCFPCNNYWNCDGIPVYPEALRVMNGVLV